MSCDNEDGQKIVIQVRKRISAKSSIQEGQYGYSAIRCFGAGAETERIPADIEFGSSGFDSLLMRWADLGLIFDITLHVGTLIAVALYFWKDWLNLLHKGFTRRKETDGKLFWYLVLATIPGA